MTKFREVRPVIKWFQRSFVQQTSREIPILEWHRQRQSRVPSFCDEAGRIEAIWINAKKHIFAIMINCNTAEINVAKTEWKQSDVCAVCVWVRCVRCLWAVKNINKASRTATNIGRKVANIELHKKIRGNYNYRKKTKLCQPERTAQKIRENCWREKTSPKRKLLKMLIDWKYSILPLCVRRKSHHHNH